MLPELEKVKLYRHRFIPNETVHLKDDVIVYYSNEKIITKWTVLKPRKDFQKGISVHYLDKGFKISKFMKENGELVYHYCDIVDTEINEDENSIIFHDLLVDVIIENDGFVKVLDLEEIAHAIKEKIITTDQANDALIKLNNLLQIIYNKKFYIFEEDLEV